LILAIIRLLIFNKQGDYHDTSKIRKTQNIILGVIRTRADFTTADFFCFSIFKGYYFTYSSYEWGLFGLCTGSEYNNYITELSHHKGQEYYLSYLAGNRTPELPAVKDGKFEQYEDVNYRSQQVPYLCQSPEFCKQSYVLFNGKPICVPTKALSKVDTAEQKAAKERKVEIDKIMRLVNNGKEREFDWKGYATKLYDDGLRAK